MTTATTPAAPAGFFFADTVSEAARRISRGLPGTRPAQAERALVALMTKDQAAGHSLPIGRRMILDAHNSLCPAAANTGRPWREDTAVLLQELENRHRQQPRTPRALAAWLEEFMVISPLPRANAQAAALITAALGFPATGAFLLPAP